MSFSHLGSLGRQFGAFGSLLGGAGGRAAYLGQVATRCAVPHRQNTGLTTITSSVVHAATDNIVALKLLSGNWFVNEAIINGSGGGDFTERGTGHSQTRTAGVWVNGVFSRFKWSGASSVTEADGAVDILSDWLPVTIAQGPAAFRSEQFVSNPSGIAYWTGIGNIPFNIAIGDKTSLDAADKTGTTWTDGSFGGSTFGAAAGYGLFPYGLLAMTKRGSVIIIPGNSRDEGIYDTLDASGDSGYEARALGAGGIGYIQASVNGDSYEKFNASNAKRLSLVKYATHGIAPGPTNSALTSLATLEATCQTAWASIIGAAGSQGLNLYGTTCDPETTGAWTLVNQTDQTISKDFETFGINPYLRSVPSPLKGCFDFTTVTATGVRGNRYWNADGVTPQKWTQDGTHPQQFAYLATVAAGIINPALFK